MYATKSGNGFVSITPSIVLRSEIPFPSRTQKKKCFLPSKFILSQQYFLLWFLSQPWVSLMDNLREGRASPLTGPQRWATDPGPMQMKEEHQLRQMRAKKSKQRTSFLETLNKGGTLSHLHSLRFSSRFLKHREVSCLSS